MDQFQPKQMLKNDLEEYMDKIYPEIIEKYKDIIIEKYFQDRILDSREFWYDVKMTYKKMRGNPEDYDILKEILMPDNLENKIFVSKSLTLQFKKDQKSKTAPHMGSYSTFDIIEIR